jgi:predicted nucleotidyltransferase/DNA-binding XRE family transcriptional regulator
MDAGSLLREQRHRCGLTQAELARRAGTSQAAVARYERGTVSPAVSTLDRLLRSTGARLVMEAAEATSTDLSGQRAARVRRHRTEIIRLARAAGATNVRLFGSTARGDDLADSDIDLLVDFDASLGLMPLIRLADQLTALLGATVDVAPMELLKPEVAERAVSEAVPL